MEIIRDRQKYIIIFNKAVGIVIFPSLNYVLLVLLTIQMHFFKVMLLRFFLILLLSFHRFAQLRQTLLANLLISSTLSSSTCLTNLSKVTKQKCTAYGLHESFKSNW